MADRKRLSDILSGTDRERFDKLWESTTAAADLGPISAGDYRCRVVNGEATTSKSGTHGYKLTLEVIVGDFTGRRLWHDIWLSPAALAMAKRDLAKLGILQPSQLDRPPPPSLIVAARVALRREDDGKEFNRVVRFDVVAVESPEPDPFSPDATDADAFDWRTGEQREGGNTV